MHFKIEVAVGKDYQIPRSTSDRCLMPFFWPSFKRPRTIDKTFWSINGWSLIYTGMPAHQSIKFPIIVVHVIGTRILKPFHYLFTWFYMPCKRVKSRDIIDENHCLPLYTLKVSKSDAISSIKSEILNVSQSISIKW